MHYMPGYKIYLNWTRDLKKQNTYLEKDNFTDFCDDCN